MSYLHNLKQPLLHGDLKAINVLVDDAGVAKITDFGFSKLKTESMRISKPVTGTKRWMSPERMKKGNLSGLRLIL